MLEFTIDEVSHQLVEVEAGVATVDAVVLVGIDAKLELFASIFQSRHHIDCVLEVDVVVASAMDEEVVAAQEVGEVKRRIVIIATGIVLRTLEETFGVDVVVVTPRDDGCDGNSA